MSAQNWAIRYSVNIAWIENWWKTKRLWYALLKKCPIACEHAFGALWRWTEKGRRAWNYVSGVWIPPPIPLWLPVDWSVRFSANQREVETSANVISFWKTRTKGNHVITNVISANQNFATTFSMHIFRLHNVVASSPSFPAPPPERPGELACYI